MGGSYYKLGLLFHVMEFLGKTYKLTKRLFSNFENHAYDTVSITYLPNILPNIKNNHIERQRRLDAMTNEQDYFIQQFLHHNQYFFVVATNTFFVYDGLHYQIYSEEDILHQVLSLLLPLGVVAKPYSINYHTDAQKTNTIQTSTTQ